MSTSVHRDRPVSTGWAVNLAVRAGEGTGGALAVWALSSIIGFSVMALAPMPIFVTFGTLTAVMIVFSLLVALLVLSSVLLVVTRSRTGAERQHFLDLTGTASGEYDPHARETALHGHDITRIRTGGRWLPRVPTR